MISFNSRLFSAVLLVLLSSLAASYASAEMRIFELQHRPVGELAEMVRSMLGKEARVAAYRNTLAVNASPDALDEVARMVASYDRARQMLRVTIEQGKAETDHERAVSASGRLKSDDHRVVFGPSGKPLTGEDSSIIIDSGQNRIKVRASDNSFRDSRQVSQFIAVLEGEPALISVGRKVPFTSQMLTYCRRHPGFIEAISYENVDTGFEVLPELYNGTVELEIRPFMNFLDPRKPQQIVFHELSTKVNIPAGTWYELGGHMQSQDGLSREIFGGGKTGGQNSASIRVKVEPQ